jgi:NADH dehydrogenase
LEKLSRRAPVRVTLVDRRNHHTFQPLLYQVATSGLQPQDVGHPVRGMFRADRAGRAGSVTVRLGEVVEIDRAGRAVEFADGSRLGYDHLVVAAGAVTGDFGVPGVREHAFGLKSIAEALALRDHILRTFERAAAHGFRDDGDLTFVVAGGGPTGVELAGAIAELVDGVLTRDHPGLRRDDVRIVLVEAMDRLLLAFHESSSGKALQALRDRGVEVLLDTTVKAAHPGAVELGDGRTLATATLIWVAGVAAAPLGGALRATQTRGGRVEVTPQLTLPDDHRVHVIGDLAAARDAAGNLLPQLAPVAMQQGRYVARRIAAAARGQHVTQPFRYVDKGTMATIGRHDAVAELPLGIRFGGPLAWMAWLGLHLLFLVGFRNRVAVFLSWLWNYLTYDRASRLILHDPQPGASRDQVDLERIS